MALLSQSSLSRVAGWGCVRIGEYPELSNNSVGSRLPRPVLVVIIAVVAVLLLVAAFSLFAGITDSAAITGGETDYSEITDRLDLQSDPEILPAEEDWRARVGIEDSDATDRPTDFSEWLTVAMIIWALIWLIAAGILFAIIYLVWRYGSVIQVGTRREAATGQTEDGAVEAGPALASEAKTPTLEAVLAIEDEAIAIGALQRLVLETALESINATLRKSETARAVLGRLPIDWRYFDPVAALVRLAERVRFAGEHLDREGLIAAVEQARPILRDAKGRA